MNPRIPLLLLLLVSPLIAVAQTDTEAETEEDPIRFYDVELILFKNLQGPRGLEYVRPTSLPARNETTIDLQSPDSIEGATEFGYELLEQEELRLIDRVERIIRSPRYELLLHGAWRQPGLELEQSNPVWIRGGNLFGSEYSSIDFSSQPPPTASQIAETIDESATVVTSEQESLAIEQNELDAILNPDGDTADDNFLQPGMTVPSTAGGLYELEGQITVSLARYLHVNADLVLRKPRAAGATQVGFFGNNIGTGTADSKILENHRLQERRRMRSATLHYLDSPHFSMLVMISPYEPEEEIVSGDDSEQTTSATPLVE